MTSHTRWSIALLLAALCVHTVTIGMVVNRTGAIEGNAFRSLDAREYATIASNLAEHGTFSQDGEPPYSPDTWRTPGYPLFLAAVFALFGPSSSAVVVVQQLLSVLNAWLLLCIASSHMSCRRGFIAALIFLVEPYHLLYSTWLLATTWFTTWILLTWIAWGRAIARPTSARLAVLGLCCGWLILIRPIALLVPVFLLAGLVVWIARRRRRATITNNIPEQRASARASARRRRNAPRKTGDPTPAQTSRTPRLILALSCLVLTALIPPMAWMVRNQIAAGHFALSHQTGIVLAYFKATEVKLWGEGRSGDRYLETSLDPERRDEPHPEWESIDASLRTSLADEPAPHGLDREAALSTVHWWNIAQGNKTPYDSFLVSKYLSRIGTRMLLDAPLMTLGCCAARCMVNLTFPLVLGVRPPNGVPPQRIRHALVGLCYLALVIAAVWSLMTNRAALTFTFFPIACTLALLVATTPQIDPRFRVPMIPLLAFLAMLPQRSTLPSEPK